MFSRFSLRFSQWRATIKRRGSALLALFAPSVFAMSVFAGGSNGPDHSLFTQVLRDHVKGDVVNYQAIKADARFPQYLAMLRQTNPANMSDPNERLAFWLNAYNAFTIQYVIDKYPVKSLMNKLAYATGGGTFKTKFIEINGTKYSLNDIENDIVRPMGDARIHFALVCGAKSCPPLRPEAYDGAKLSEQLDDQGRIFLSQTGKNRFDFDRKEIYLSKIFDWFKDDFRKDGKNELDFISRFLPAVQAQMLLANAATLKVKHTDYDWSLNE
jgi:hypothetical protein